MQSRTWDLFSDDQLITAVRSGETAAFGALYGRHVPAARAVAQQYLSDAALAEDVVSEAFSRVLAALQGGGGPDVAFRAYLFAVLRRVAVEHTSTGRHARSEGALALATAPAVAAAEPVVNGYEQDVVTKAYRSLPERWQSVLWYTEVEGRSPAEVAPVL